MVVTGSRAFSRFTPKTDFGFYVCQVLCVSAASCERSFCELKLTMSHPRSTMSHVRLYSLAIFSIYFAISVDVVNVISNFASGKALNNSKSTM